MLAYRTLVEGTEISAADPRVIQAANLMLAGLTELRRMIDNGIPAPAPHDRLLVASAQGFLDSLQTDLTGEHGGDIGALLWGLAIDHLDSLDTNAGELARLATDC